MKLYLLSANRYLTFLYCFVFSFLITAKSWSACPEGRWISNNYLSTLLAGNPSLTVTSESTELRLQNGAINLSANADIEGASPGTTMTGNGVLKARGRYQLRREGGSNVIRITSVLADIFNTKLYINGTLAIDKDYRSLVFADRSITYRCRGGNLLMSREVNGRNRNFTFRPAR